MKIDSKTIALTVALIFAVPHLRAQTITSAPLPAQLAAAKTVFISNALDEVGHDSEMRYEQLYAAVQSLNRFTIVNSPQQADLVLQFRVSDSGAARTLHILDPKTNVLLWSVTEGLQPAVRASTLERYLQITVDDLAKDLQILCAQSPATH